ncbi:unnamed protein product [Ectocarpus sp. 13 AM-2016]
MVLVAGGELFTGNTALVTAALVEGKATVANLAKNWTCSWAGNLLGSVLLAKLVVAAGINAAPGTAAAIAVSKVSSPFLPTFLKGIVCNWMVCMAVWVAAGATSLTEKYLAMILPVSAFVAFGAEHSVSGCCNYSIHFGSWLRYRYVLLMSRSIVAPLYTCMCLETAGRRAVPPPLPLVYCGCCCCRSPVNTPLFVDVILPTSTPTGRAAGL